MSKYNPFEFERWRKLMLGGALVLLFVSILRAAGIIDGGPLYVTGLIAGYLLLAGGFADGRVPTRVPVRLVIVPRPVRFAVPHESTLSTAPAKPPAPLPRDGPRRRHVVS